MLTLRPIDVLPENFDAFIHEIGKGLGTIYEPEAEADYQRRARAVFLGNIAHPDVVALGVYEGSRMAGMIFGLRHETTAEVSFIHVLEAYAGQGAEDLLVETLVRALWNNGTTGMVAECIPLCRVNLHEPFMRLGFEHIARELMRAPAGEVAAGAGGVSRPLRREDWVEAAECIVDAYTGHPGRRLHFEVSDVIHALAFIERVMTGGLGPVELGYARVLERDARCAGVVFGCEIAPHTGFVLQVAVHREFQGQGVGGMLVRELAQSFSQNALRRIVLGVTRDNPARRLYDRLGFAVLRPVDAYVRWRH